ncbi:MAG: hypothetical protein V1743_07520 [Nanoarchaeota archaeon]
MTHYLLDIKPAGLKGRVVAVTAYDTAEKKVCTAYKEFRPLLVTKEYTLDELHQTSLCAGAEESSFFDILDALRQRYPGISFQDQPYSSQHKSVIWAQLEVWEQKDLLPDEFFRTIQKCYTPRTGYMKREEAEELLEQLAPTDPASTDLTSKYSHLGFSLEEKGDQACIRVQYGTCAKKDLKTLPPYFMTRAGRLDLRAENITTEEKAKALEQEIKKELRENGITDVATRLTSNEDQYFFKLIFSSDALQKLDALQEARRKTRARDALEEDVLEEKSPALDYFERIRLLHGHDAELWTPDLLQLGSKTKMLHRLFPQFLKIEDPGAPLEKWIDIHQLEKHPHKPEHIEQSLEDLLTLDACAIDLEIRDYDETQKMDFKTRKKRQGTGQIFQAILKSEHENKLFTIVDVITDELRTAYHGFDIIQCHNEEDLIRKLSDQAKKYTFIGGHRFIRFDQNQHLLRYNTGKKKAWEPGFYIALDTQEYLANRASIKKANKLANFAGFTKELSYQEIRELLAQGTIEAHTKIAHYTIKDGEHSYTLLKAHLKNILLESLLTGCSPTRVCTIAPDQLLDSMREREFFVTMNTFRERHDKSYTKRIERVYERAGIEDLLEKLLSLDLKPGYYHQIPATYPDLMFKAFQELIEYNPLASYLSTHLQQDPEFLSRLIKVRLLSAFLKEPVHHADKLLNKLNPNHVLGSRRLKIEDIYPSLQKGTIPSEEEQKSSMRDWRWRKAFCDQIPPCSEVHNNYPYSCNTLLFNNRLFELVHGFDKSKVKGTSNYFYFGDTIPGIQFGKGNLIFLEEGRLIGTHDHETYIGVRIDKKQGVIQEIIDKTLHGEILTFDAYEDRIKAMSAKELRRYRDLFKAIFHLDIIDWWKGQTLLPFMLTRRKE